MTTWKCRKCSYVYDPAVGDPDGGIPAGTPFARIPDSWRCPICGAKKSDFYELDAPPPKATAQQQQAPQSNHGVAPSSLVEKATPARTLPIAQWTVGSLKGKPTS